MYMYLSGDGLEDFNVGFGELKVGDTARGAFTAALPKPPIRHMWERIPNTGETPPSGGLTTYLYKLVRYEADPEPIDVSKLVKSEAELVAEANAADTELQKMVAEIDAKEQALAAQRAAVADQAQTAATLSIATRRANVIDVTPAKPWYKRPIVLASIVGGVAVASVAGLLLMKD
jgi:hypothetical protein